MSLATAGLAAALLFGLGGTVPPVRDVFAYSRETLPGIPPGPGVEASPERSLETTYFIYVVLQPHSVPTAASVWLEHTLHEATLEEVATPVTIERNPAVPTGERITLVPATSSPTYRVLPGEERPGSSAADAEAEAETIRDHDAVVVLTIAGADWPVPVETIEPLPAAPGI